MHSPLALDSAQFVVSDKSGLHLPKVSNNFEKGSMDSTTEGFKTAVTETRVSLNLKETTGQASSVVHVDGYAQSSSPKKSFPTLMKPLQALWEVEKEWKLIPMGKSFYSIAFSCEEDKARVKSRPVWDLLAGTMRLREWVRNFNPYKEVSSLCQVWTRIYYLPLEYWTLDISTGIGRALGTPIKVDSVTALGEVGHYACILIEVDLAANLSEVLLIDSEECSFYVEFDFEHLPAFCSKCKLAGHSLDKCNKVKKRAESKPEDTRENSEKHENEAGKENEGFITVNRHNNWKPKQQLANIEDKNTEEGAINRRESPLKTQNAFQMLDEGNVESDSDGDCLIEEAPIYGPDLLDIVTRKVSEDPLADSLMVLRGK
ncbi:uncharacterized protein LOC130998473 [Salvia miltiorrhiza]|uniref:uncharacterized protein LOC130998473 n=1 Tax=Salvia miltiorrhiza TaxID=226208 RepID=UPI0025ABF00B|nr:uncharacterized protein LOC130998473 [Salvia miltiorrhiza]